MLIVKVGATVIYRLQGHSNINGAVIPEGSVAALLSNAPEVATVPASVTFSAASETLDVPVTILAAGATDIFHDLVAPDGSHYQGGDTLIVEVVIPGLLSVSGTLIEISSEPA